MLLSHSTEYAIHSLFYLALQEGHRAVLVSDIARAQNVSESYLAKIFQSLVKAGLVRSYRGAKGGFHLARSPEEISLRDIVQAVEGSCPVFNCSALRRDCELTEGCRIIEAMNTAEEQFYQTLAQTTLKDLVDQAKGYPGPIHWLGKGSKTKSKMWKAANPGDHS